MSNIPEVTLPFDPPRRVRLDFAALMKWQRATGREVFATSGPGLDLTVEGLPALIWAGIQYDEGDDELGSPADVEKLLHIGNMAECFVAMRELLEGSMPSEKASAGPPASAPRRVRRSRTK